MMALAYDIDGEPITNDDNNDQLVYCYKNRDEWWYIAPDAESGDLVTGDQCDNCGNAGSWVVTVRDGRPVLVTCDPARVDDTYDRGGCGEQHRVASRRVGNESVGVVMP